jgi:hypothetical protein
MTLGLDQDILGRRAPGQAASDGTHAPLRPYASVGLQSRLNTISPLRRAAGRKTQW